MSDAENCSKEFVDEYISTYKCHDRGMIMPFINEYTWSIEFRRFIYIVGLLWCFLGIAIIADIFMCAIEKITSKTRPIKVQSAESESGYVEVDVKVWNNTVANLTLMALGSSAPEILLSCIILIFNKFEADALGPGTIVGSAAFNLLVITAVCCVVIPSPEIRTIREIKVFAVTAFFSIFAYVWLVLILSVITPNYVDLWEAIVTFLMFPALVIIAYIADKDYCSKKKVPKSEELELGFANDNGQAPTIDKIWSNVNETSGLLDSDGDGETKMTEKKMREFIKQLRSVHPHLHEEDIAKLAAAKLSEEQQHSRLWYRINATRSLGGNPKMTPTMNEELQEIYDVVKDKDPHDEDFLATAADFSEGNTKAVIEFTAAQSAILESDKRVRVGIRRYGKMNSRVIFKLETIDGTAEANSDYVPIKQTMVFEKDEDHKHVDIEIIDDNDWEPDEVFFVKLSLDPNDRNAGNCLIGQKAIQEITIINDDEPGTFEFAKPSLLFKESCGKALIPIERANGADGRVVLKWKTEDITAHSGSDYEGGEGTITFEHGEVTKMLELTVYDDQEKEKDESFRVEIFDPSPGAKLGRISKTIVTIVNDDDFNGMVSRLVDMANLNMDALKVDSMTWGDQFRNAMNVNGGDVASASHLDYVMHFLTFGWKLIFAMVPPPSIWGGWLAFFCALAMIAMVTIVVGDLAGIFGCLIGLDDSVTAITFVALGTSLPDLFASKQAATQEKTADNSIGNVTGSNSVNVFLGLGLPWTIAAIYWTAKGETFEVKAGTLVFSVIIYVICACICISLLMMRRYMAVFGKGELGGTFSLKVFSAVLLIFLWLAYIILSALQAYDHITVPF